MIKTFIAAGLFASALAPASAATLVGSSVSGTITPINITTVLTPFAPNAIVNSGVEFNGTTRDDAFGQIFNIAADVSENALTIFFTSTNPNANISGPELFRLNFGSAGQLFNPTGSFTQVGCTFSCGGARSPSSFSANSGAISATFNNIFAGDTFRLNFVAPAGAVPEPATWAMMILGMGAVGYAMRRRIKVSEVNFTNHVRAIAAS